MTDSKSNDYKTSFEKDGFVIIDSGLDHAILDGAREDMQSFFTEDRPRPLRVPLADFNRVQDGWHVSQNVLKIAQSEKILAALEEIYQLPAKAFQTLNFLKGTEQAVHADNIHFNSEPFGLMCGVWVALEDIGPDQGPLVYYPGSQELPEMNYDDFGLEGDYASYPQYLKELEKIIKEKGYQPEYGLIKKGQAVIWSANVLHGGSIQKNTELTRHSQVTHYYIGDPICWRPSFSKTERAYYQPDWVRDVRGEPYWYPEPPLMPLTLKEPIDFFTRTSSEVKRWISGK